MNEVLVTGGSGYIAGYVIIELLKNNFVVRTTVRNLKSEPLVKKTLEKYISADLVKKVIFFEADLLSNNGWKEAMSGVSYVFHVASPIPSHVPADENELIIPAQEGTLRILRLARDLNVKRVIFTSSSLLLFCYLIIKI
jgi:dihydroflavonol-4-reductase